MASRDGRQAHDHRERDGQPAADDADQAPAIVDRPVAQHELGDDRELADEHRGEDEEAPQRGAPEFPDPRRHGTVGGWIRGRGRVHQTAFSTRMSRQRAQRVFDQDGPGSQLLSSW